MQYSTREYLEISGNHHNVKDKELETKVLDILENANSPEDPGLVEICHGWPFKGNGKKVILKQNRRKEARKKIEKIRSQNSEPSFWHNSLH